jgi:hypothetical protein
VAIERAALMFTPRVAANNHHAYNRRRMQDARYTTSEQHTTADELINVLFSCRREQFVRLLCDWAEYGLATYGGQHLPVTQLQGRWTVDCSFVFKAETENQSKRKR